MPTIYDFYSTQQTFLDFFKERLNQFSTRKGCWVRFSSLLSSLAVDKVWMNGDVFDVQDNVLLERLEHFGHLLLGPDTAHYNTKTTLIYRFSNVTSTLHRHLRSVKQEENLEYGSLSRYQLSHSECLLWVFGHGTRSRYRTIYKDDIYLRLPWPTFRYYR